MGYAINSSSGKKIDKNVYNNTCQVEILGKEKLERVYPGKITSRKSSHRTPPVAASDLSRHGATK